jgi:L-threonylcarbamoyladenylate synthase
MRALAGARGAMVGGRRMPRVPPTRPSVAGKAAIARAARALRTGRLVAFPTETVYGLGADATDDDAVAAIYAAKGRPRFNPLIVHVPDLAAAEALVRFDARARRLARRFWPGPLTLVLPRRKDCEVSWLASAGLDSLAIRVPDHPVALALLRAARIPVVAPSANRSGRVSPTCAAHVARDLGARVDMILDGGACRVGVESTVVDLVGPTAILLRPGGADAEAIEEALGARLARRAPSAAGAPMRSPGQLASHYAPRAAVRLEARRPGPDEAFLAFGAGDALVPSRLRLDLSPRGDLAEAAANLFAMLRALDRKGVRRIAVAPIPRRGLGLAINDRLARAAAPRS